MSSGIETKGNPSQVLELELGDFIKIVDRANENLNDQVFYIDYIDDTQIFLINSDTFQPVKITINPDGTMNNGTIGKITILNRSDEKGYARQHDLLPNTWIDIHFGGDLPTIITGLITNLEHDMIEVKTTYGDTIYINFDYKGIPLDLPIKLFEIRSEPSLLENQPLEPNMLNEFPSGPEEFAPHGDLKSPHFAPLFQKVDFQKVDFQKVDVRDQLREFIINADQIVFGERDLGTLYQYEDVSMKQQRYSIESQVTDMLDEFLSNVPDAQRTQKVLNNIHTMIERFKQLRENFSSFDEYGNVEGAFTVKPIYKPLFKYFERFQQSLYWILPVVKNTKKVYNTGEKIDVLKNSDLVNEEITDDVLQMKSILDNYKSNDLPNKYQNLYADLNPYFTPFEPISDEQRVMIERNVNCDLNVIVNNLDNMYSSIFTNNNIRTRRFVTQKYNLGLKKLDIVDVKGNTKRVVLTPNDTMEIQSFITLPEPTIRFSKINLPGTNILERANLNQTFLNLWQFLNKKTDVKTIEVDVAFENPLFTGVNPRKPPYSGFGPTFSKGWVEENGGLRGQGPRGEQNFVPFSQKGDGTTELQFNEETFVNNIKNYVLTSDEFGKLTKDQVYAKFIETIVPKTKILFNLMKKYIYGKLSIVDVVSYLEPFLIYTDSLTYMQYTSIVEFINKEISKYNTNLSDRSRVFGQLRPTIRDTRSRVNQNSAYSIITILKQNEDQVFESYGIDIWNITLTNDEILRKMTIKDCLRLYTSALSLQSVGLTLTDEFSGIFNKEKDFLKEKEKEKVGNECDVAIIAKSYSSITALEGDNGKDIYFDKKYDSTNYSLIDNYESKMFELQPDEFVVYLTNDLKSKLKLDDMGAKYLVDTLINGYKKVRDGQYAMLFKEYTKIYTEQYDYFIRKNNVWEKTDPPLDNILVDDIDILCNLKNKCMSVQNNKKLKDTIVIDSKCEPIEKTDINMRTNLLNEIMDEFDNKYQLSKEDQQEKLQTQFDYLLSIMGKLDMIEQSDMLKYNNIKYRLGYEIESDTPAIISPYFKIRDLILAQQDFVKKQNDIIKFKKMYTREAIIGALGPLGEQETPHWLYCIATGVKLLPIFKYDLACVFLTDRDNYSTQIELLKAQIGKQSDDGDRWVDKYSGWPITNIDLDTQEGYDEGFKVSTRAVLEEEIGDKIIVKSAVAIQFDNPEARMISNVVNALSHNMGINVEAQKDFIVNTAMTAMNNVGDEADYNVRVKDAASKNRTLPSYADYRNSYLLFCTLGLYLIAIQTCIPSVRTKRTLPGCVKSFSGYPFEGNGDMSSVNYLTCVVDQVRRGRTDPWNVLARVKKEAITDKIKRFIDDVLSANPEVKRKIGEKVEYLLVNPEPEIPDTANVVHWDNFLPPLVPFKISNPATVTSEFEQQLMKNMRSGSRDQNEKLLIIESKIILFSLAIQEKILDVVKSKDFILSKANNEPYLENACCDSKSGQTTIEYFEKENPKIKEYNQVVEHLTNILADVVRITKSGLLYSKINTKNVYPSVSQTFGERTIYRAFIHYCNFNSLKPVPGHLQPICKEKPSIKKGDTVSDIIRKLKSEQREYSNETFLRLLQIVGRNNIVDVNVNAHCISSITKLLGVLESVKTSKFVKSEFTQKLYDTLDTFSIATSEMSDETEKLNNYLIRQSDEMKKQIMDFLVKNKTGDMPRKSIENVGSFINTFSQTTEQKRNDAEKRVTKEQKKKLDNEAKKAAKEQKNISSEITYNVIQFMKTFIDNFVNIFPSIILNKVNYADVATPQYWKLSKFHNNDIKTIIREYYEKLKIFYDVPGLFNILSKVKDVSADFILLANSTPCFSTINYKGKEFVPVIDEQTSQNLFEYYLLSVVMNYIELTDQPEMIVTEIPKTTTIDDVFSVDSVQESVTRVDINVDPRLATDTRIFSGNKKLLKQQVAHLLVVFFNTMDNHKTTVEVSYEDIQDRVFKLKEREKNIITDRLKGLTPEERDADTILKINKLGVWSKGLQKGLTSYVAETYDDERELRENFDRLEKKLVKTNADVNDQNRDMLLDDLIDQEDMDNEQEQEAYDMRGQTDDYADGNFEGDEVENYGDYD